MLAPRPYAEQRASRVLVSVAAVAVVALDVLYLVLISSQGGSPSPATLVTPFVAGYLALIAASLGISLVTPPAIKGALRGAGSGGLLAMTVLTALSIGVAVLVAAVPCVVALVLTVKQTPTLRVVLSAVGGIVIGAAVLVSGLWYAWSVAGA